MKNLKYLLMLFVLMIIVPIDVLGDNRDDRTDNNHIVSVEDIYINGSDITVSGYAFISHMDNYGLLEDVGNIKSYVVAYNDNFRIYGDGSDWFNSHLDIIPGRTKSTTDIACKSLDNCYIVDTDVVARDMWFSRCTESCNKEQAILNARKTSLLNSSACRGGNTDCIYYNVGFRAKIELDVIISSFLGDRNGVTTRFESTKEYNNDIKFAVVTINVDTINHIKNGGAIDRNYEVKVLASYLPVNSYICNYRDSNGNKTPCSAREEQMTSGLYSFSISELPSVVSMDAREAIPKWNCDGTERVNSNKVCSRMGSDWVSPVRVFAEKDFLNRDNNLLYRTAGWVKKTIVKPVDGMDASLTTYEDGVFKLEGYECTDTGDSSLPNKICPVYDGFDKESRDWDYYWADANWVKAAGIFKINSFKLNVISIECDDIDGDKISDYNGISKSASCDSDSSPDVSFYSCDKVSSVESTIYLKEESSTPQCITQYVTFPNDSNYYIPVTIRADVLVEQEGKFHFADFGSNHVRAGKGFSINNIRNGISYTNDLKFVIANKYSSVSGTILSGTPYISYSGERLVEKSDASGCESDSTFNLTEKIMASYNEGNSGGQFYYKNGSELVGGNSLFVMINALNNSFISSYAPNYNNRNDTNDKSLSEMFKFKSCDSNSSKVSCDALVDVDGVWNSTYSVPEFVRVDSANNVFIHDKGISPYDGRYYRGFGKKYSSEHIYNLPYAYIALSDMVYAGKNYKYADIVYATSLISNPLNVNLHYTGNKYFVGFKYAYDNSSGYDFPFDLERGNVSLVEGMTWNLSGTCGVDVEDGYYTCSDPGGCNGSGDKASLKYKYRSINVGEPFPKFSDSNYAGVASNWENWYWSSDITTRTKNRTRLKKSYDTLDYSVTFLKYNDRSKLDISDVVNCSRNGKCSNGYGSMSNFGITGSPEVSRFVNEFFEKKPSPSENKYCGLGLFSLSCDGYSEEISGGFIPVIPNTGGSGGGLGGTTGSVISGPITGAGSMSSSDGEVVNS